MNQHKDSCVFVELFDTSQSHFEILHTFFKPLAVVLDFKHIYENLYASENCLFLNEKILLHEGVLASAVPEIQSQGSHEFEPVLLFLDCITYFFCVFSREVSENDRVHGGLAGT